MIEPNHDSNPSKRSRLPSKLQPPQVPPSKSPEEQLLPTEIRQLATDLDKMLMPALEGGYLLVGWRKDGTTVHFSSQPNPKMGKILRSASAIEIYDWPGKG